MTCHSTWDKAGVISVYKKVAAKTDEMLGKLGYRADYIREHLRWVWQAIHDGVDVRGKLCRGAVLWQSCGV